MTHDSNFKSISHALEKILTPPQLSLVEYLEQRVHEGLFTHWSFGNKNVQVSSYFLNDEVILHLHPPFDLASLTKPLFLNTWLRQHLGEEEFLEKIFLPLKNLVPPDSFLWKNAFKTYIEKRPGLCLNDFISHTSGLRPWAWLGRLGPGGIKSGGNFSPTRETFLNDLCVLVFESSKNSDSGKTWYSDLNYMILTILCEEIFAHKFSGGGPLALCGESHDVNAQILAQASLFFEPFYSGHAGFWGTVQDVLNGAQTLAVSQEKCLQLKPAMQTSSVRFVLGLDTPTDSNSTAGLKEFTTHQPFVFGHLGYTGTSFWLHTRLQQTQCLLVDRTKTPDLRCVQNPREPKIFVVSTIRPDETNPTSTDTIFLKSETSITPVDFAQWQELWQNRQAQSFIEKDRIRLPTSINHVRQEAGYALWDFP